MATAHSLTLSTPFRLIRLAVGTCWYLLICVTIVNLLFFLAYLAGGEIVPTIDRRGYSIGAQRSPFILSTTMDLPIHIDYYYTYDSTFQESPVSRSTDDQELGNSVLVDGFDRTRVRIQDRYGAAMSVIMTMVQIGLAFLVIYHLRNLCRSIGEGEPFSRKNVQRLRHVGATVLVWGPLMAIVNFMTAMRYVDRVVVPDARVDISINYHLDTIGMGLFLLIVAQLIDLGTREFEERRRLQDEQRLTV